MSIIGDRRNREAAEKRAKENELMKVSIKKEDVDLIVSFSFIHVPFSAYIWSQLYCFDLYSLVWKQSVSLSSVEAEN